ncbi:MAG: ArnT family glycosyltransferase [Pseudomonadota bacterium]|jgi:4-amino-4-deoxy-L-arabinose transferase-like glycosyltransferase
MLLASENMRRFWVIVLLAALLCVPWLARPFHTRGEPREALVAQAMLVTGNWISPPAYDGAVPSKPPFSHWLIALVSLPTGQVTEATARLPSALAVVIFSAAFFRFVVRRASLQTATGASLILLASSEWFRSASTCRVDTILATSMAGALISLYSWWERKYRGVPWLAIVLIACAALTKGPVGIVLPLALFSLFCWVQAGFSPKSLTPIAFRATVLCIPVLAIASIWYLLGYLERGEAFIEKIRYENFERFTSSMADEPHKHSLFYLLGMLCIGLLPWSLCLLWPTWFGKIRGTLLAGNWDRSSCRRRAESILSWWHTQGTLQQFAWIVGVGIVAFFCIPSSKRSVYLLPAYPFFALLLEQVVRSIESRCGRLLELFSVIVIWCVVILLGAALLLCCMPIAGIRLDAGALWQSMGFCKISSVVVLLIGLGWLLRDAIGDLFSKPIERLAISLIVGVSLVSFFIYDGVAWQLSPKRWLANSNLQKALDSARQNQPNLTLFSYGSEAYGASFYLNVPFRRATVNGLPSGSLVFLERGRLAEFQAKVAPQVEEIMHYSSGLASPKRDTLVVRVP